jgi:Cu/Ag efflux protein CusF
MMMIASALVLAACDSGQDAGGNNESAMPRATSADKMPAASQTPPGPAGEAGETASGKGTVTEVNAESGTITIDHGAIEAVNWPAMTMAFQADETQRQSVAVSDHVTFQFRTTESGGTLTSIKKD